MHSKLVSVLLLAVLALAMTGCASFKQRLGAAPARPPQVNSPTRMPKPRPPWVPFSVFNNLLNARAGSQSYATVLVTNKRTERIALQIGDRLLGIPDENGVLGVMILPPGESFAVQDPGLGQTTALKAVVISDQDVRLGYVGVQVTWPRGSGQEGVEVPWDVNGGTPAPIVPPGVDPMIPLPRGSNASTQAAPILSPLPKAP